MSKGAANDPVIRTLAVDDSTGDLAWVGSVPPENQHSAMEELLFCWCFQRRGP